MNKVSTKTRYRKALVLVAVMWIIVLLTLIVAVVAQSGMIDTRITHVAAERMRCKWACRGGLEMAVAVLNDDATEDETAGAGDSYYDIWSSAVTDFNSVPLDDGCTFTVEVIDEAGKLNINTATKEQLFYIPDMTEDIADSIIDWRDGDDDISQGGAESGYYLNLPFGYETRNAGFKTIRELLLVKGVTRGLFLGDATLDETVSDINAGWINYLTCYSYDTNKDSEGNDRINVNSANESQLTSELGISQGHAAWIVANRSFDSIAGLISANSPAEPREGGDSGQAQPLDLQTYYSIVDKITVSDENVVQGKVNINTAPEYVLQALFEGDEQAAYDVVAYRESLGVGITSLAELQGLESVDAELIRKIIGSLTTRSNVYTVHSIAKANATGVTRKLETVVDRSKSPTEILYFRAGAIH